MPIQQAQPGHTVKLTMADVSLKNYQFRGQAVVDEVQDWSCPDPAPHMEGWVTSLNPSPLPQ